MVFGDFDADGLDGLAILVIALRRFGRRRRAVRARAASTRATACRSPRSTRRSRPARRSSSRSTAARPRAPRSPTRSSAASTSSSPTTTASRPSCRRPSPSSTRIAPTRSTRTAGWPAAASRSRSPSSCSGSIGGPAAALDLADLATIGTVADVAPIVGENRAIARLGLERLRDRATTRASRRCSTRARLAPADVDLDTHRLRHRPAAQRGRSGGGGPRGRAACCWPRTPTTAAVHAAALEAANTTRRDLMTTAVAEARAIVADATRTGPRRIVRGPWPVGIVGLVAARLADDRARPAVVGAELGDTIRASCRSDGALDLGAALEAVRRPVHCATAATPARPGSRSRPSAGPTFVERFEALADGAVPPDPRPDPGHRPGRPGPRRRLRPASRPGRPGAVRPGQPRAARRRPRPDRDPRPPGRRRTTRR